MFFEATDLHIAVVFNLLCTASPRSIVATHYTNDPHLKLDQTKSNTALCIKNLVATSPKMVHDPAAQCSLRKIYTKQMFVFGAHAVAQPCKQIGSKAFQTLQRICSIYTPHGHNTFTLMKHKRTRGTHA